MYIKQLVIGLLSSLSIGVFPNFVSAQSMGNPSQPNYSYPPINNNGGIIQGISGSSQCGTSISAEVNYGNTGSGNTIYSGSTSGFDPNNPTNQSGINGKIVLNHSFNPCLSQKTQLEMQMKESCASRKDQFIDRLVAAQPNVTVGRIDELVARMCKGSL